ncbi:MAG: minor capsid protein [Methanosarcinales archaeon]|nr:minor capsid protein [Methanosarcinales archaeon]
MRKSVRFYNEIGQEYLKAISNIEKEIRGWYFRYASANGMTLTDARKLLTAAELDVFKMSVEEYIELGKKNAINPIYMKQLEAASVKAHITRLEALQLQMVQQANLMYAKELHGMADLSKGIYATGYYHTAYEIQRGAGIGRTLQKLDPKKIERVVSRPWTADGLTFSGRIWKQQDELVAALKTEVSQMLMRGEAPDRAIKNIAKKFGTSKANAGRLIMTESAYFASAGQKDSFRELGVEKFEFVAALDEKTCGTCGGLDGKVGLMSVFEAGITAPPLHPHCRCTTVPYFADMEDWGENRAACGEDGQFYEVPAEMTYKEWFEEFVEKDEPTEVNVVDLSHLDYVSKIKSLYEKSNGDPIIFAQSLMDSSGINVTVKYKKMDNDSIAGECNFDINDRANILTITEFNVNEHKMYSMNSKFTTVLHESFHANMSGLKSDLQYLKEYYTELEETFAETSSLYLSNVIGIQQKFSPAYSKWLVSNLPRLKMFDEFKDCVSIFDFGKVASEFRFSSNKTALWQKYFKIYETKIDIYKYGENYMPYITKNKKRIFDLVIESNPGMRKKEQEWSDDLDRILSKYDGESIPGESVSGREQRIFEAVLIVAMDETGIRGV